MAKDTKHLPPFLQKIIEKRNAAKDGGNMKGHEGGLVHGDMHKAGMGLRHETGTANTGTKGLPPKMKKGKC